MIALLTLPARPSVVTPPPEVRAETGGTCPAGGEAPAVVDRADPPAPRGSTLMLVGDSLAVGMGPRFSELARHAGHVPVVHALVGTSSFQWIRWLEADLRAHSPAMVYISLGTNDAITIDRVRGNPGIYAQINELVEAWGARSVWIGPPRLSQSKVPHADEVRGLIGGTVPLYFDSTGLDLGPTDGVHPGPKGYARWMETVWRWSEERGLLARLE